MMGWMMDNWWVALVAPYLIFNGSVLYLLEEGEPLDRWWRGAVVLAGLWVVLFFLGWQIVDEVAALRHARPWRRSRTTPLMWRRILAIGVNFTLVALGLASIYILGIVTTGYLPGRFEIWCMWILVPATAAWVVYWTRKENP